ncbi:hypothetical protein CLV51_10760 [Chitinophaga niastensis]|uniref:Uncharacterized protein n=1 Tax=Chitinophaga niastensis TaxID=536980 RepID=A0A2P8HBY2_CHINA|nr:hypothetical protein CLV51_10760 [Chitinophaga niastensis]
MSKAVKKPEKSINTRLHQLLVLIFAGLTMIMIFIKIMFL